MAAFLRKFEYGMDVVQRFVSGTSFLLMVLAVVFNVFARALFSKTYGWTEEISYLMFTYSVFFGAAYLYKKHGLIMIEVVVDHLPEKIQRMVKIFNFALLFLTNIALADWSSDLAVFALNKTTTVLGIPYFYIDISITLSSLMMAYYSLKFLVLMIQGKPIGDNTIEALEEEIKQKEEEAKEKGE